MEMPPIHMCAFLSHENERLKTKIINLKRHIAHLEQTIARRNLDQNHSCSISCQTDIGVQHRPNPTNRLPSDEQLRLHGLLKAQNELLKKYENESAHERREPSPSGLRLQDYERRLSQCEKEKEQAEKRASCAQKRMEKCEERYERMKREISALDDNFFEEIEDLKFALQQANKLNQEYEKTVQTLSARLGISYPAARDQRN